MLFSDTNQIDDLKRFLAEWSGNYRPDFGMQESEIPEYFPEILRDFYAFAGRWPEDERLSGFTGPGMFQRQDYLYAVDQCEQRDGYIYFVRENQGNWYARVEAGKNHSPVFSNARMLWDESASDYELCCKSLSHFLKTFCLQELVMGCKQLYTICIRCKGEIGDKKLLFREPIKDIWLDGYYSYPYNDGPTHSFYQSGTLLVMTLHGETWIGCNTDEQIESHMKELPPNIYLKRI